ncbi:MAG: response regulator [Bacteroidetes bacterium]|nr:response regulator [Bacteroidota bacterium]
MIICIVDDDLSIHTLIKEYVREINPIYKFISFTDGIEIYDYLQQYKADADKLPSIIFLDLNMPVMDGFSFLEKYDGIRSSIACRPQIYVVSTVTHRSTIRMVEANRNVTGFIAKPFEKEAIIPIF